MRRHPLLRGLPKRCECGGRMLYAVDFGRVFSICQSCSPNLGKDVSMVGIQP